MALFCCRLKLGIPKTDASGKEANVEISVGITGGVHQEDNWFTFNLVKENKRWLIMSWKYRLKL